MLIDISNKSFAKILFYVGIDNFKFEYGISISHSGTKKKVQELEDNFKNMFDDKYYETLQQALLS